MPNLPATILVSLVLTAAAVLWAFLAGLIRRNYSTVDRLWSLLPGLYVLIWLPDAAASPRYWIAGALVIAWSIRLTRNFALKGGYRRENGRFVGEDYRWEVLRQRIPNRAAFEILNFFFISTFQPALIFAFTLPLSIAGRSTAPLGIADAVLFLVHLLLLTLETVADEQQFRYYARRKAGGDPRLGLGFNTYGLWRYSRHPNYVCEMGQWVVVSLYPVAAGLAWFPTGLGVAVLVALFVGSTVMAEGITGSKYPRYSDWKKATPPWIPFGLVFRLQARRRFWESLAEQE